ncbi:proto-oncogene tyrosine-protein kinase receptor Ret-like [Montipora capricornis]|uniref:proto-oncogene tyrosine-protein kinase receptor Ret-like n=1 Tax=Montipora capricornis TaxID=246305 RepID=UPI0035F1E18A
MWSQHWNLTDLRNIDREARKVISENGGKHPLGSIALLYLPRHQGGRGLRSVETEYKHTKIKSAIKLYQNKDPTMSLVVRKGRRKPRARPGRVLGTSTKSNSTIIPLLQWEVCPDQVDFKEEIGRGAFGKVLRGIYRESPGIEVFCKSRTPIVDFKEGKTVAVKVLGDNEDQDARNQFLEEIELMKAIGSHKNVVSMLGCCVNSEPIFLLLEYLPYGDLQHWLRNKRLKKSYQKFYADDNDFFTLDTKKSTLINDDESKVLLVEVPEQGNNPGKFDASACGDGNKFVEDGEECLATDAIEVPPLNECCNDSEARLKNGGGDATASIMRNEDLSREPLLEEGLTSRDPQKRVMNQYEDRAGLKASTSHSKDDRRSHEENVAAEDLLCFAWQIARGMSYLSSNGFVHRDLAARNILLGEDRVVKISDFGLMRHVEEGLYTLKKGKKLPVKWTAPEALYNSEYTTKSDVWSFGVVLWELCTMGGNPYPGVNNKELYKLLKTGYRMERPETCSNELFQLVSECWKEEPSKRPTFDQVSTSLEKMLMEGTPYLDFELLDESKEYYSERLSENDATT